MTTTFGSEGPVVGPVISISQDALATSSATVVTPTGLALALSLGTPSPSLIVPVTGNALAFTLGTVSPAVTVFPTGLQLNMFLGSATVSTGSELTVGVSGNLLSMTLGSPTLVLESVAQPTGMQMGIILGQPTVIASGGSVTVTPTGLALTFTLGTPTAAAFVALIPGFDPATANLNAMIDDLVIEDDYELTRTIVGVPQGATLQRAWLTIKAATAVAGDINDAEAVIQKTITTTPIDGEGHISDSGASGTAVVVFQITADETEVLIADDLYLYDIQVESSTGKFSTRERGTLLPIHQVTQYP